MPILVTRLLFSSIPRRAPFFLKPFARMISKGVYASYTDPQIKDQMQQWNHDLGQGGWFAGDVFTAADIIMSYPVEAALSRMPGANDYPAVQAYAKAIQQRPAYQRAVDRVGGAAGIPGK
jgi:glutathione S-transferase